MTFKDLNLIPTLSPLGVQAIVDFGKYELSIIQNKMSYGHEKDLYEIAVFDGDDQVELPGITEAGDTILAAVVKAIESARDVDSFRLTKIKTGYKSDMAANANPRDGYTKPAKKKA